MQLFLITIFGLILRLFKIIKPEGLWNDEYVSWMTASVPFGNGFWEAVAKQCHMPLYYLYLKPFVNCSDIILRLTSVIPSLLAIPVMYLVGKEYSKRTGLFCAGVTATLPFLIFYAQEVRFYSLVFLLSSLVLLFAIGTIKSNNYKNLLFYGIFSILLVFTHHLGLIYLFFISLYIYYKKGIKLKEFTIALAIILLIILPFGFRIISQIPSSQWWGSFSHTNIMFLFSDFFSPILTNHINAPKIFYYNEEILFGLLITIPTLIALVGIITGSIKNKGFGLITVLVIIVMSILACTGKVMFITKYMTEILPILILLFVLGYSQKYFSIVIGLFIAIQIYSIFTPFYPTKNYRSEGHRIVGEILNSANPDKILFTYYAPDRFYRYWNKKGTAYYISKINRFDYNETPQKILKEVKSGDKTAFVFLDSVCFIEPHNIELAKQNNLPEMFITFSEIRNKLVREINDNYKDFKVYKQGSWTVITAVKK